MYEWVTQECFDKFDDNVIFSQYVKDKTYISSIFLCDFRENYDIIDVYSSKSFVEAKKSIDLTLHIRRRVFIAHDYDVEEFLISMSYHD